MFCFFGVRMVFFKALNTSEEICQCLIFLKKKFAGKKKKNSLSLDVAAWLHVKRSPDVQVAAPARRHCEGCYVPSAVWKRSLQCHRATPEAAGVVSFTCKKKKEISENMTLKGKQKHELSHASKKWNQLYCKLCSCFAESAVDIIGLGSAAALNNDCVSSDRSPLCFSASASRDGAVLCLQLQLHVCYFFGLFFSTCI